MKFSPALALAAFACFPCEGQLPPPPPVIVLGNHDSHTNWLGWDDFLNPVGTRYRLLIGWSSGVYSMTNDVGQNKTAQVIWPTHQTSYYNVIAYNSNGVSGTNGEIRLPRPPRTDTNILIIARGTNLKTAPVLSGPWLGTGATIITLTNPTGTKFVRGNGKVSIVKTNF